MFGFLNKNNEEKMQLAAESRAMNFNREQGILQPSIQESQTELLAQEGKSDLIKWQQELEEDLFKLCCKLTGWKESSDEKGNKIFKHTGRALCNDLFIDYSKEIEGMLHHRGEAIGQRLVVLHM